MLATRRVLPLLRVRRDSNTRSTRTATYLYKFARVTLKLLSGKPHATMDMESDPRYAQVVAMMARELNKAISYAE